MNAEIIQHVTESGLDPAAYYEVMEQRAAIDPSGLEDMEADFAKYAAFFADIEGINNQNFGPVRPIEKKN